MAIKGSLEKKITIYFSNIPVESSAILSSQNKIANVTDNILLYMYRKYKKKKTMNRSINDNPIYIKLPLSDYLQNL